MLDKKQQLKSRRSVDLRIAHIDVCGGQDGEDVSLQASDQRFEQEHEHASREGDDAEWHEHLVHHINEEVLRGRKAQRKNQVARNHVGEQSDRQRERTDNQQLKQLNRGQQNVDRGRNTLREDLIPQEVAEALFTNACNPVLAEAPHGEYQRQRNGCACRDIEAWMMPHRLKTNNVQNTVVIIGT